MSLSALTNAPLRWLVKAALRLRYRIRVQGLDDVARRGTRGILFLPNHPALIDPVIVYSELHARFAPRAIADRDQINASAFGRWAARRIGIRPLPDIKKYGPPVRAEVEAVLRETYDGLRRGENLLIYPSGHLYRSRNEDLRGNSSVEAILKEVPGARIVLVRTRGLWGSAFSMAGGRMPGFGETLRRAAFGLLKSLIFFAPRRSVTLELFEPADFPRHADRQTQNAFIERFYNADAPPATYVPYTPWERGGPRELPEPNWARSTGDVEAVPEGVRERVLAYLRNAAGHDEIRPADRLGTDLGLDSLARAELLLWLEQEFGFAERDVDALQTVADVMLATRGEAVVTRTVALKPPPADWFAERGGAPVSMPAADTIVQAFLNQARRAPDRVAVADQLSGGKTYRELVTAVFALRPHVAALPGERVGIMLPASVAADVAYLAVLFSGKTPVMVNWTAGARNVEYALESLGVQRVLTAGPLVAKVESQGTDLSAIRDRLLPLEVLARRVGRFAKLAAWLRSRVSWAALAQTRVSDFAAILLTSGSETLPKAVPLSHCNVLCNIADVLTIATVRESDSLMGILPPFHSFGLTVTMLLPLVVGVRVVHHANPTEAWTIARLIEQYRATVICGTPTFLSGILRASTPEHLRSLRIAVTGAEKCPERTYAALARSCPGAVILEGYGVTECSPIVSANREADPRPGTIGRVLPSYEHAVVDVDAWTRVRPGGIGMLLVRGPSVFAGYIGEGVESPFVEFEGRSWYRTGDLVVEDADGVLTFRGRLKRFVKVGGEMVSLPAIESVLERVYAKETDEGPVLAVAATADEQRPELVLFTTLALDRATVNRQLREAGLTPLYNIARVVRLDALPLLGTGKTDYRALARRLAPQPQAAQ